MLNPVEPPGKTIAYFVTEDWYFCSHRLPLAVAAKEAGYKVFVVTRVQSHGREIESAGLNLIPLELSRRSKNPLVEIAVVRRLTNIYREIQPDLVHHVAIKPVIYGSVAARVAKVPAIVNALAGLGYLFSSDSWLARVLRPTIKTLLRILLNNDRTSLILQNPDDVSVMLENKLVSPNRVQMIMGSGVDLDEYYPQPEPDSMPIVMLASRLLWDKGVGEFVSAARILRNKGVEARFVLVGTGDDDNPESISEKQLNAWKAEGDVECWGRRSDMPAVFASSHIVCLPSYREGMPRVLIEAAACGRPIVTTDAPGCREIVRDGENGFLVPIKDAESLADAIHRLLESRALRARMGAAGRERVMKSFSMDTVINKTLAVYGGNRDE